MMYIHLRRLGVVLTLLQPRPLSSFPHDAVTIDNAAKIQYSEHRWIQIARIAERSRISCPIFLITTHESSNNQSDINQVVIQLSIGS